MIWRYERVPDIRIDELGNGYQKQNFCSTTAVKNIRLRNVYSVITMAGCAILIAIILTLVARHWYVVQMRPKNSKKYFFYSTYSSITHKWVNLQLTWCHDRIICYSRVPDCTPKTAQYNGSIFFSFFNEYNVEKWIKIYFNVTFSS